MKGIHIQLGEEHKELQSRHAALYEERHTVERQYQSLCDSWRLELEEKNRQLEQVKSQAISQRDVDLMRVSMREKVEAPLRAKCDQLAREAEAAHQTFVRQRREYEELQTLHRTMELQSQRDKEKVASEHLSSLSEFRDRLQMASQAQSSLALSEAKCRTLEREKQELTFQASKLKAEVDDLRRHEASANAQRDSIEVRAGRKVKEIEAEEMQMAGMVETLTRKNRHLHKELTEAQRSCEEMFEQRMKTQASEAHLKSQLEASGRQHEADVKAREDQHFAATKILEDRLIQMRDEMRGKEKILAEAQLSHQEQISQMADGHGLKLEEVDREHLVKTRGMKSCIADLNAKIEVLKSTVEDLKSEREALNRKSDRESEQKQRQLEQLQTQLSETKKQLATKETEAASSKDQVEKLKAHVEVLESSVAKMKKAKEELDEQVQKLTMEMKETIKLKSESSGTVAELKKQIERMRESHVDQAEQQRQSFATEKSITIKRYQSLMKDLVEKHESELKKHKRRLKHKDVTLAQINDEMTELRLKSHELEMTAAVAGSVMKTTGRLNLYDYPVGTPAAARDQDLMAELSLLRKRQIEYLEAIA